MDLVCPWSDNVLIGSLHLAALRSCVRDDMDHWHLEYVVRQLARMNTAADGVVAPGTVQYTPTYLASQHPSTSASNS